MGSKTSKDQDLTTNGAVNNNLTIETSIPIHNDDILTALYIIIALMTLQITISIIKEYKKAQKKRYLQRGAASTNNALNQI